MLFTEILHQTLFLVHLGTHGRVPISQKPGELFILDLISESLCQYIIFHALY